MGRKSNSTKAAEAAELQEAMQARQVPEPEPGNETDPNARAKRNGRLKVVDLPGMKGKGVERLEDAGLESLGDELDDLRTKKRKLAEKITAAEGKAIERMKELGITVYRWQDRELVLDIGKDHAKVRMVKEGETEEAEE